LSRSRGGVEFNLDNLGSNGKVVDPTTGLPMIADGWGTPIIYFRWATGNSELGLSNPASATSTQARYPDPQDPNGALLNPTWWLSNHAVAGAWPFDQYVHSLWQINTAKPADPAWPFLSQGGLPFPATGGPLGSLANPQPYPYFVWANEYYTVPVIASAGPNKTFGILGIQPFAGSPWPSALFHNPMIPDATGDDSDNVYSYRLRLGARGG